MTQGRRVYLDGESMLRLAEGDYGQDAGGTWSVRPPGQHAGGLPDHKITEHDDGTITVSPSIVAHNPDGSEAWHGYLERGVWRSV